MMIDDNTMENTTKKWLEILMHNKGFSSPDHWVEYARAHNFQKVKALNLDCCPDCGSRFFVAIGQYIYYSTLIKLQLCKCCGLYFADTHIDQKIINKHFEDSYKDEQYFSIQRKRIFDYIALLADHNSPKGARVFDIGGGKGHLLARLRERRPDLNLTLNDISRASCEYAKRHNELDVIRGPISSLGRLKRSFDTILLIDVIYYEPDLRRMWENLARLVTSQGTLIIRVPNKLPLIKFFCKLSSRRSRKTRLQSSIRFFNPEHIYIFSRSYLKFRLTRLGFKKIVVLPSPLLEKRKSLLKLGGLYFSGAQFLWKLSLSKAILTPSMIILAKQR